MKKGSALILVAIAILVIGFGVWYFGQHKNNPPGGGIACTEDAMQCPDGTYVGRTGPDCAFAPCPSGGTSSVAWLVYSSREFGLSFSYPPTWQKSNDALSVTDPHVFFGNPLNGTTTYDMNVFVPNNPQNLSAADFVKQMLVDDAATDASYSAGPRVSLQFANQFNVVVGGNPGYELNDVFEFDHQAELIYVQQNKQMIVFDFPTADANPNISDPAANNAIAHRIVNSLRLDPSVWKFCGGIAAGKFPCDTGYSCKLDGTFPDAGGHCVKN